MSEMLNHQGIEKLCAAVGIDPSVYVSFRQPRRSTAKAAFGAKDGWGRDRSAHRATAAHTFETARLDMTVRQSRAESGASIQDDELPGSAYANWPSTGCRPEQIALLSTTAETGKTMIAGLLGTLLANRGHSVLLADHAQCNGIQQLFVLDTDPSVPIAFADGGSLASPLSIMSLYRDGAPRKDFESWFEFIAQGTQFIFHDGLDYSMPEVRELLAGGAKVLVPVLPDVASALAAVRMSSILERAPHGDIWYILNRFDSNRPAHRAIRKRLRESLGERLLPFEVNECTLLQNAATRRLLVNDIADLMMQPDLGALADWIELSHPVGGTRIGEVIP